MDKTKFKSGSVRGRVYESFIIPDGDEVTPEEYRAALAKQQENDRQKDLPKVKGVYKGKAGKNLRWVASVSFKGKRFRKLFPPTEEGCRSAVKWRRYMEREIEKIRQKAILKEFRELSKNRRI